MKIQKRTVSVATTVLTTLDDCHALQKWTRAEEQEELELGCSVHSNCDNHVWVQLDGRRVSPVIAVLGDTVIWDGTKFIVERQTPLDAPGSGTAAP